MVGQSESYESRTVSVDGIQTHYLEAGDPDDKTVVLVHSGEFGASAELSWRYTISALAEEFHVLAPDLLGYGRTDKVFDFEDAFDRRIRHVAAFLELLNVDDAHFVGNSMGAGYLMSLACEEPPLDWPIDEMILVSGGGGAPDGFDEILTSFECTREDMEALMDQLFFDHESLESDFLREKLVASRVPGHWQCLSAIRFDPPFEQDREFRRRHDYENIDVPTLLVGGRDDPLKPPEEMRRLANRIPSATLELFEETRHCAQLERPEKFNELAIDYLLDR